jgi:hypothetical protein
MRLIDPPGPTTLQFVFWGFRFAYGRKRFPLNLANQANDTDGLRSIFFHLLGEVFERRNIKLHAFQQGPLQTAQEILTTH